MTNDEQQLFLRKLNRRTRFTQFLVWIALFFTAAGIAAGYKNWLRIHDKAKTGLAGVAEIKKQIPTFAKKQRLLELQQSINKQLEQNTQQFDSTLKKLKLIQQGTEHIAASVYDQVKDLTQKQQASTPKQPLPVTLEWQLSEIKFLLQTAIYELTLKYNKETALSALKLADKRLLQLNRSDFFPLRKQISQDIARLEEFTLPDMMALSAKISELQAMLEASGGADTKATTEHSEPLFKIEPTRTEQSNTDQPQKESILNRVKKTINDAVVIRKFDKQLSDEMDAESRLSLLQLLSLKLETLRIMLFKQQEKNYHKQISELKKLLLKYHLISNQKQMIAELEQLDSINLKPEIPDISGSLKLLNQISK